MNVLEARDLYRFYHTGDDEVLALRGVSVIVAKGETVAVVGPSGSGKSTLLACLAGIDEPDGGAVTIAGQMLTRRPEHARAAIRAAHIGVLLQSGNLLEGLSVEDNIRVQMALGGHRDESRVEYLLAAVGLAARRKARAGDLSGGESARAAFAAALANEQALLLADEPTGEVDADAERTLLELLHNRRVAGGSALIVTHSDALAAHADRVVRLSDGRLSDA
jgi:putative ABC transport system ATP-binding protein